MEDIPSGFVDGRQFAYEVPGASRRTFEFVDVRNIDELVGAVTTRGRTFWVNQFSCIWPAEGYGWVEHTNAYDVFLKGRGQQRRAAETAPDSEPEERQQYRF